MADVETEREFIVAGNWKMHGSVGMIEQYCATLLEDRDAFSANAAVATKILLFPAFCHLGQLRRNLEVLPIAVGAQNIYSEDTGAFTGEVSAAMLRDLNIGWVLVGHSERRQIFAESNSLVAAKVRAALRNSLRVILCVGESLPDRKAGQAEASVMEQLVGAELTGIDPTNAGQLAIAYEPIWAIGTGETATPEVAAAMHGTIRGWLKDRLDPAFNRCPILYGGSVTEKNAAGFFRQPEIDGALVGGAALDAQRFLRIIAAGNNRIAATRRSAS